MPPGIGPYLGFPFRCASDPNVVGAAPGEAPVLYVSLGDQVPGIGRIKSIYQRGTSWVVQTDAGLIQ